MADFVRVIAEIELSRPNRHADAEVERETALSRVGRVPGRQEMARPTVEACSQRITGALSRSE